MKSKNLPEFERILQQISVGERMDDYEISVAMGYNSGYIAQQRSRAVNKGAEIPEKFMNALKTRWPQYATKSNTGKIEATQEPAVEYATNNIAKERFEDLLVQMIRNTTTLVESNKLLVETNAAQTRMLEKPTERVPGEIPEAWLPKVRAVLGSIAKAGTSGWKSEQEAIAELSKLIHGTPEKTSSKGIRSGSGKVSS